MPRPHAMTAPFLTAEWRWLVMANRVVNPSILAGYVPAGTTIDAWNGRVYVSLVAFRFLDTRVLSAPIPLHRDFDEINLLFYVRRPSILMQGRCTARGSPT